MSLLAYRIQCDWPACDATVVVKDYAGNLHDRNWRSCGESQERGPHLCSTHRFKTALELEEARADLWVAR